MISKTLSYLWFLFLLVALYWVRGSFWPLLEWRNCVMLTLLAEGKACTSDCMVVIFVQLCLRVNSALLLLLFFFFFNIIYYNLFWFLKHLLWTYLLCSFCSVGCGHSIRNLLTVAWWISVYAHCPEDSTTFLYVQVTFREHDQLYNPLRSSAAIDVQMELSPLWYSRAKQTTMPLQMDIW